MKVALFSAKPYDVASFTAANGSFDHELEFFEDRLRGRAAPLAEGFPAVCLFVNDIADARVLAKLADRGVRYVALRCAGFNNLDLRAAGRLGIGVVRVPAYSPNAVAEHTIGLILTLNRRIHRAYNRVRDGNFSLDGLVGFDLAGKTAGVVGTGKIGALVARLLWHFRCRVLAHDIHPDADLQHLGVEYCDLETIWSACDLVSLNCPLTPETRHLVRAETIARMKPGVMIVNTGRGALVDTVDVIDGLKSRHVGALALDVYEEEAELFFEDRSADIITDDAFARLMTFPNVLVTAHQAFLTHEALNAIATITLQNLSDLEAGRPCPNAL